MNAIRDGGDGKDGKDGGDGGDGGDGKDAPRLLPCPYCGSAAAEGFNHKGEVAICPRCGASEAEETWNRRAPAV